MSEDPRREGPVGKGGKMAPRRKQTARERRQPRQRWTLGNEAPSWLRRIWRERSRETPKTSVLNMDRLRRIAYL